MTKIMTRILSLAALVLMFCLPSFGQAVLTQTTLSAALTCGPACASSGITTGGYQTTVSLTSATGVTQAINGAPVTYIYVDQESIAVMTLVTGQTTVFNALRGQMGTKIANHQSGATVVIGLVSPQFAGTQGSGGLQQSDPGIGNCTAANTNTTPWINVVTGQWWACNTVSLNWEPVSEFLLPSQNAVRSVYSTTYTNATTTFSNVPGLSFYAQPNRNYEGTCKITWQGSANTSAPKYQITGPASPTAVLTGMTSVITATTVIFASQAGTTFSNALANTGANTTATNFTDIYTFTVQNGANAGIVQLQMAANGAGTLTVAAGSTCSIQ